LVIVKGTGNQLSLVRGTLDALRQKMLYALKQKKATADGPKSGDSGGVK